MASLIDHGFGFGGKTRSGHPALYARRAARVPAQPRDDLGWPL